MIERDPWKLELYRYENSRLVRTQQSTLDDSHIMSSEVVPLTWKLAPGAERPEIEVIHNDGEQRWVI